jgi:hypothetical protein
MTLSWRPGTSLGKTFSLPFNHQSNQGNDTFVLPA